MLAHALFAGARAVSARVRVVIQEACARTFKFFARACLRVLVALIVRNVHRPDKQSLVGAGGANVHVLRRSRAG